MQLVWFQEVSSDIAIATGSKALPTCFRYDRSTLFMSQLEMQDKMFTFQCEDRIGTLKARPNERMKIESKIESKVSTARNVAWKMRKCEHSGALVNLLQKTYFWADVFVHESRIRDGKHI